VCGSTEVWPPPQFLPLVMTLQRVKGAGGGVGGGEIEFGRGLMLTCEQLSCPVRLEQCGRGEVISPQGEPGYGTGKSLVGGARQESRRLKGGERVPPPPPRAS
jgi:hypothetical protein